MSRKNITSWLVFFAISALALDALADNCPAYDQVTAKLSKKYGEQKIFSGFANKKDNTATAVYEFWSNPKRGNWSLIAHKLVLFQINGKNFARNCTFIINAGGKHHLLATGQPDTTEPLEQNEVLVTESHNPSCLPRSQLAKTLKQRYDEVPVVQALAKDEAVLEIYGGDNSWTISRAKLQGVTNTLTGRPLVDTKTGQEIRQICSTPVFSGKFWGAFEVQENYI